MAAFLGQSVYEIFWIFKTVTISHEILTLFFSRSVRVHHNKAYRAFFSFLSTYIKQHGMN